MDAGAAEDVVKSAFTKVEQETATSSSMPGTHLNIRDSRPGQLGGRVWDQVFADVAEEGDVLHSRKRRKLDEGTLIPGCVGLCAKADSVMIGTSAEHEVGECEGAKAAPWRHPILKVRERSLFFGCAPLCP